jgi:N-acetylglucosaminyl-diphospho-decaprenol L-rhamnosyltransferase
MLPSLDIIIVNWNSHKQLRECMGSIIAVDKMAFHLSRVIVVDNASTDGSADGLHEFNLPLYLIQNSHNRGFAAACNQGSSGSNADYLLFLNPDTRLSQQSLNRAIDFMQSLENKHVGILGVQMVDDQRRVSRTCARFPTPLMFFSQILGLNHLFLNPRLSHFMKEWDHMENREVDHVTGAFFFVRRSLFETLGKMDESFYVYLEDLDFSLRAYRNGWRSFYLADVQIYHRGGGTSEQAKPHRLFYSLRSRILYGYKNFARGTATALMLGTLFLEPVTRIGFALLQAKPSQVVETLKAYALLWRSIPQWVVKRTQ